MIRASSLHSSLQTQTFSHFKDDEWSEMRRFLLYHRKHPVSEGCRFLLAGVWRHVCNDSVLNTCDHSPHVSEAMIYRPCLFRASALTSNVFSEWVYVNPLVFFFCDSWSVWFSERKTSYQEHLPAIKAFIGFLWPGHKDSCGRQQWLWYRTEHTMNLSIFGQTVASEHSCRKLYQPCTFPNLIYSHGYRYYSDIALKNSMLSSCLNHLSVTQHAFLHQLFVLPSSLLYAFNQMGLNGGNKNKVLQVPCERNSDVLQMVMPFQTLQLSRWYQFLQNGEEKSVGRERIWSISWMDRL